MPRGRDGLAALPGARDVDAGLVERAVEDINALCGLTGLAQAEALGAVLLARFFEGDALAAQRFGRQHVSLAALARRDDLRASPSHLWFCLAMVEHLALLPGELREVLSFGHHKALVAVKDPERRLALARQAAAEGWTVEQLREATEDAVEGGRGRPRLAPWVKGLRALDQMAARWSREPVSPATVAKVTPAQARTLVASLDSSMAALIELRETLAKRAAEREP